MTDTWPDENDPTPRVRAASIIAETVECDVAYGEPTFEVASVWRAVDLLIEAGLLRQEPQED